MIILPTEKRFDWRSPPVVLLAIVLSNLLVFFFYQSGDTQKINSALEAYYSEELLSLEWPIYQQYLQDQARSDDLEYVNNLYKDRYFDETVYELLMDRQFFAYLSAEKNNLFEANYVEHWQIQRAAINAKINSTSVRSFGLVPNDIGIASLLGHQFLHGGIMHLLGNLFFLIVCGFAVEAAIGHRLFLLFYLLSGIAGGLCYSLMDLSSAVPLVGASGAISGVMAMYLGVFRLKKIEFFYWFFIFVGYFRAPALMILPFYIGKECYDYFTEIGSHVAYMAHVGGFLAGAVVMLALLLLKKDLLNENYIEEDQTVDPQQLLQADIHKALEGFHLQKTLQLLDVSLDANAPSAYLVSNHILKIKLLVLLNDTGLTTAVRTFFAIKKATGRDVILQEQVFNFVHEKVAFSSEELLALAMKFSTLSDISPAERLFQRLVKQGCNEDRMAILAGKIAYFYQQANKAELAEQYQAYSDEKFSMEGGL